MLRLVFLRNRSAVALPLARHDLPVLLDARRGPARAEALGDLLPAPLRTVLRHLRDWRLGICVAAGPTGDAGERAALMQALMRCRAANTGYVATAPPNQGLELFFDLTRRSTCERVLLWLSDKRPRSITYV